MHTTDNYQLCQWESADRILMESFNGDNAKIDAALKANADAIAAKADQADLTDLANRSRFTQLKEVNITSDTTSIEIDLSDIDWTQWANVHLDYLPTNSSQMWLYINTVSNNTCFYPIGGAGEMYQPWLTLYVGFRSDRVISANYIYEDFSNYIPYSQLQKFIINGSTMHPDARFIIWGEK